MSKMIDRINKNEERLDKISSNIIKLEEALKEFRENKKDLYLLNKYYGSKNWFKDKETYEKNKIPKVKAGVLSEDAVWDLNESLKEVLKEMKVLTRKNK